MRRIAYAPRSSSSTRSLLLMLASLLDLRAGILDRFRPLRVLALHERHTVCNRPAEDGDADLPERGAGVGRLQDALDLGRELRDDLLRRLARREDAVPARDLESRQSRFGDRRQIGEQRIALRRRDSDRL